MKLWVHWWNFGAGSSDGLSANWVRLSSLLVYSLRCPSDHVTRIPSPLACSWTISFTSLHTVPQCANWIEYYCEFNEIQQFALSQKKNYRLLLTVKRSSKYLMTIAVTYFHKKPIYSKRTFNKMTKKVLALKLVNFFQYELVSERTALSEEIIECNSLAIFKRKTDHHLGCFSSYRQ